MLGEDNLSSLHSCSRLRKKPICYILKLIEVLFPDDGPQSTLIPLPRGMMPICWAFKIKTVSYLCIRTCNDAVTTWQSSVITIGFSERATVCCEKGNEITPWLRSLICDDSGVDSNSDRLSYRITHILMQTAR